MNLDIAKHLARILYTGHHHDEIKEWVECSRCSTHIAKWKAENERLKALHPQYFIKQEAKTEAQRLKEADAMFNDLRAKGNEIRVEINDTEIKTK